MIDRPLLHLFLKDHISFKNKFVKVEIYLIKVNI